MDSEISSKHPIELWERMFPIERPLLGIACQDDR
jgi:hypothetical protein